MSWGDDDTEFLVVMNADEQYSIWPSYKDVPAGWSAVGVSGRKDVCLKYIDETWTDMRPLSLRRALEERERTQAAQPAAS